MMKMSIDELQQRHALERLLMMDHLQQVAETGQGLASFEGDDEPLREVLDAPLEDGSPSLPEIDGVVVERDSIGSHLSCDLPVIAPEVRTVEAGQIHHHLVCDLAVAPRWEISEVESTQYLRCDLPESQEFSLRLDEALQYLRCEFPEMTMALEMLIQAAGIVPAEHWSCALPENEVSVDQAMEVLGIRSMTELSCDVDYSGGMRYEQLLARQMRQQEQLVQYLHETVASGESLLLDD